MREEISLGTIIASSTGSLCGLLAEDGSNFGDDLIDCNRREALFAFNDAVFEAATPAVGLVVENAMLLAEGKPDARLVAGGEDGDAWGLDGCGEVHWAAVVADKYRGPGEDGGALAWGWQPAGVANGV